jgi:RNA polymerase sigma-70 factor (sigma-E family)
LKREIDEEFSGYVASRWSRLLRAAFLLTGNHHDAEELLQSALARAYVKWAQVQRSEDVDAYVWRIIVHSNVDRFRRRRVREWMTAHLPEASIADQAHEIEQRDVLLAALARLPPRQRSAVVLCYFEDLTHDQAAAALGTKAGTVRSQVSRALAKLRSDPAVVALVGKVAPATVTGVGFAQREEAVFVDLRR